MALKKPHLFKVALYQPDIPQNTASIIRTCSCLGADLEIIEPCGFLLNDKRFKRVVMDYKNKCNLKSFVNFNEFKKDSSRKRIILMTTKSKKTYYNFALICLVTVKTAETIIF